MPSEIATIANLLKEHDLMRLFTFMQDCSLDDLQTRLASNRPRLLAHLRAHCAAAGLRRGVAALTPRELFRRKSGQSQGRGPG